MKIKIAITRERGFKTGIYRESKICPLDIYTYYRNINKIVQLAYEQTDE
jgi:hypothetical protein